MPAGNRTLLIILGVIISAAAGLGAGYLYLTKSTSTGPVQESLRKTFNIPKPSPTPLAPTPVPTPRPIKSLPSGRQEYNVSYSEGVKGPRPFKVTIDPLTPAKGAKQTVQAMITSDAAISEANIILHTDNKETKYPLKLIAGETTNGTWEASWTMDDAYDYNYYIQFSLKSANGTFQNGLRFRQE